MTVKWQEIVVFLRKVIRETRKTMKSPKSLERRMHISNKDPPGEMENGRIECSLHCGKRKL